MSAFTLESVLANCYMSNHNNYEIIYLNADQSSWVLYIKNFIDPYINFDELWAQHPAERRSIKMAGKEVLMPRYTENYGVDYYFSGTLFRAAPIPECYTPIINKLQQMVVDDEGESLLNNILVNWYADGNHYIGPHTDREKQLYKDSPILTLSLGATRTFKMVSKTDNGYAREIKINDRDLLIMGGTTQATHLHTIPKTKKAIGGRISITMRCFKK